MKGPAIPGSGELLECPVRRPEPAAYVMPNGLRWWLGLKALALLLWIAGQPLWALVVYLLLDPWFLRQVLVPRARGFGPVASSFRTTEKEGWLTIDDGPDPLTTPRALDLLDHYGARATFFLIGTAVERHPEWVGEILRRGHTVGNHTFTHPCWSFWRAGPRRIGREIDACNRALAEAGAPTTRFFRMPVGMKTPFLQPALATRGMSLVAWSARGFDCTSEPAAATRRILQDLQPGAVLLLHEGGGDLNRLRVMENVLQHLQKNGYRAVVPPFEKLVF